MARAKLSGKTLRQVMAEARIEKEQARSEPKKPKGPSMASVISKSRQRGAVKVVHPAGQATLDIQVSPKPAKPAKPAKPKKRYTKTGFQVDYLFRTEPNRTEQAKRLTVYGQGRLL